jgi:hypothetical protein
MIALKERADKEHQSYLQEVKELERQLEQDRKLKEFLTIKTAERNEGGSKLKRSSQSEKMRMKLCIKFLLCLAQAVKGSQELLLDQLSEYKKAFETIYEVTKCKDVESLMKRFASMEDINFSLFNYTNEIHSQVEGLSEEIARIQGRIRDLVSKEDNEIKVIQREVNQLERKLLDTLGSAERYHIQNEEADGCLTNLYKSIAELSTALKLENTSLFPESDKANTTFIVENGKALMEQLRFVEDRTNQLLMKNVLIALPKKFSAAAFAQTSDEKETTEGEKPEKSIDSSNSPAALAAMLKNMLENETLDGSGESVSQLVGILGQGPSAPVNRVSIQAPSTE